MTELGRLANFVRRGRCVRSSAMDEDGRQHSFAGQLDSFLFVSAQELGKKIADVWRSAFSVRVITYRREHGLSLAPRAPAVLVQRMVRADTAGVAFGADPATGEKEVAVVCAVSGVGAGLVSGDSDGETYHVRRESAPNAINHSRGSNELLTSEQVRAIAELAWSVERILGCPQDIEWAFAGAQLYLLQARPITTLRAKSDAGGELCLWDNSNIAESYNGVTTPLTFSFARRAYEEVYRQFCRLLRVPESKIAQNDNVFRNMLGLIRGRVLRLLNWYRGRRAARLQSAIHGTNDGRQGAAAGRDLCRNWRATVGSIRDGVHLLRSAAALSQSSHHRAGGGDF